MCSEKVSPQMQVDEPDETRVDAEPASPAPASMMALQIGWPAFVMAGVLEALVFSVVDPNTLHWFGSHRIECSSQAIYTVSFFIFWLVISVAGTISRALMTFRSDVRIGASPPG